MAIHWLPHASLLYISSLSEHGEDETDVQYAMWSVLVQSWQALIDVENWSQHDSTFTTRMQR